MITCLETADMKFSMLNILMGAFCAAILGGCGEEASENLAEKAIESAAQGKGEEVDVNLKPGEGTMTISTPEGKMTYKTDGESMVMMSDQGSVVIGSAAKIPDNFPKDVPIYPGFKLQAATTMGNEGAFSLSGTVNASFDEVKSYYQNDAPLQGWQETVSINPPQTLMLAYQKDNRIFHVTATTAPGEMTVSITTDKK